MLFLICVDLYVESRDLAGSSLAVVYDNFSYLRHLFLFGYFVTTSHLIKNGVITSRF